MSTTETVPHCANHPSVETYVSCSHCGKPICPDCMIQAPVGIKCRDCARMPRSARVRLKPDRAARGIAAAVVLGLGVGFALASLLATPVGFFGFFIAWGVGILMGEAVKRATGYYLGRASGLIAAGGALLAYVSPLLLTRWLFSVAPSVGFGLTEVVLGGLAAFVAYHRAT
jgi:hypothetical protein